MKFDLARTGGNKKALEKGTKDGWILHLFRWLRISVYSRKPSIATIQGIENLIKSGYENGVDQMKITRFQTTGVGIGGSAEGIPVKAIIGKSQETTLEVKYKDD